MANHDEERELRELLRLGAGAVFAGAFILIVLAAVFTDGIETRTTLLLGLATTALTAAGAMFGVTIFERLKK